MNEEKMIWVFNGANGRFPNGIFYKKHDAEVYIKNYGLSGVLTLYPIGKGIYEWAIENDYFIPKSDTQRTPEFIQKFSGAMLEHYHYENGVLE